MGYYADRSLGRGQLYLITREEEPFCGKLFLKVDRRKRPKTPTLESSYLLTLVSSNDASITDTSMTFPVFVTAHQYHVSIWAGNEAPEKSNFGRVTLTLQGDSGLNESFPMTK